MTYKYSHNTTLFNIYNECILLLNFQSYSSINSERRAMPHCVRLLYFGLLFITHEPFW